MYVRVDLFIKICQIIAACLKFYRTKLNDITVDLSHIRANKVRYGRTVGNGIDGL